MQKIEWNISKTRKVCPSVSPRIAILVLIEFCTEKVPVHLVEVEQEEGTVTWSPTLISKNISSMLPNISERKKVPSYKGKQRTDSTQNILLVGLVVLENTKQKRFPYCHLITRNPLTDFDKILNSEPLFVNQPVLSYFIKGH